MIISEAAKRYAKALYDSAKESGKDVPVLNQIRDLAEVVKKSPEVKAFFASPVVTPENKNKVFLSAINGQNILPEIVSLIQLLSQKNRLNIFEEIADAYQNSVDKQNGVIRGSVKSATVLDLTSRKAIEEKITNVLGKKVILSYSEDPSIIGGLIAHVGGWTFDDSLKEHLKRMNEDLKRRAN